RLSLRRPRLAPPPRALVVADDPWTERLPLPTPNRFGRRIDEDQDDLCGARPGSLDDGVRSVVHRCAGSAMELGSKSLVRARGIGGWRFDHGGRALRTPSAP